MANLWGHPSRSPAPAIGQRRWAIDTDRDVEVDYEQFFWKDDDVLGLDVKVGNTLAVQKCDTLYQLPTEIHSVVANHPVLKSII
jgi:hypothetical protein